MYYYDIYIMENSNDNINKTSKNKLVGKQKGSTKSDIYYTNRVQVIEALDKILCLTQDNRLICINDIDKDDKKISEIKALEKDIKKFFNYSSWSYFKYDNKSYVSLLKSVYKDMNYTIVTISTSSTQNKKICKTTILKIIKNK